MTATQKTARNRVLVVDDEADVRALLDLWLTRAGFSVSSAASGAEALQKMASGRPDLIITDLKMDGMTGIDLLTRVHGESPLLPVIMLSGQARIPDAVKATHLGSAAFLTKPVDESELLDAVRRAMRLGGDSERFDSIFAERVFSESPAMAEVLEIARMVADSDVTVLITGATGSGKEVVARAIHDAGPRREQPFIAVNCGAIPEQLLESELFGHEKGAFTGAHIRHEGLFRAADGGTLFLDEIGDMPLALQAKLLRVLQDFSVRPVGSVRSWPVNVRIISATHHDLEEQVRSGQFREDLYYRLRVVPVHMPALAERREDIPSLATHFLEQYCARNKTGGRYFSPDAMEFLVAAPWPGNVRQLNNVVDMCATLTKGNVIPLSMARKALQERGAGIQTLKEARQAFEYNYLVTVLRITHGHVANAARVAGRNRTEFYKLLNVHGIDPSTFRADRKERKGHPGE